MSLETNKLLVRRYQDAYNRNDFDALAEIVSPDLLTPTINAGMPTGAEGAKAVHQKTILGMPDYRTEIEDLIAEGDKVTARVRITGTHTGDFWGIPATGRRLDLMAIYIVRIADGKIVEHWGAEDSNIVIRQLGFRTKLIPREE
jgi:steroid delta-isomerase-like uncharacterized protein